VLTTGPNAGKVLVAGGLGGSGTSLSSAEIYSPRGGQTIALFRSASAVKAGGTIRLSATGGGSGNPVVIASLTPAACTVNGTTVTGVAVGSCTITANQAGNVDYAAAAQVTQTFAVR
jgi:hypothetical protein